MAFERADAGIVYPCRFDPSLDLWAILEGFTLADIAIAPIEVDDPDLVAVARLFGLTFER